MRDVLDRGGHLSELALDVYRFDGASPEIDAHLAACSACREALAALVAEDAGARIPSPRARRSRAAYWVGAATLLAAAAVAFVVTRGATSDEDTLRLRGGAFDFEVFVHDGEKTRAVIDGDTVHPGERMGFRVRVRESGYLLVIGHDDTGNSYVCYPPGELATAVAQPFPESPDPQALPVAMRFDDVLGSEHLVALLCPAPLSAADLMPAGTTGAVDVPPDCTRHTLTLHKRPHAGDGTPR